MKSKKIIFFIAGILFVLLGLNLINQNSFSIRDRNLQRKILEKAKTEEYIDFKDILSKEWDTVLILDLNQNIEILSKQYNRDFSGIKLPYRDRRFYQLIIFYNENKIVKYGLVSIPEIQIELNSDKERILNREDSKFHIKENFEDNYTLYK